MDCMISIVIPAYNEEQRIATCLQSLCKQNTEQPFEVIVVNNASTDRTKEVASAFADQLELRIIDEPKKGRGAARSRGWSAAQGTIIYSTDADATLPPTWIERFYCKLEDDATIVGVCSGARIHDSGVLCNTLFNCTHPIFMRFWRVVAGFHLLPGFSFALRKDAYDRSGGFDPSNNGQEDVDLSRKIGTIGPVFYAPKTPIVFSGRRFHRGILKGIWEYIRMFYHIIARKNTTVELSDPR